MPVEPSVNLLTEFGHPIWMLFVFLVGACIGSYLNVCIYRIPKGLSTATPGSHCFACGEPIKGFDNIPILSYFILRGKCRTCGAEFSWRYAAVEALTGILFLALWWVYHDTPWVAAVYLFVTAALVFGSFVDFDHKILPDRVTLGLILLAPVFSYFLPELHERTSLPNIIVLIKISLVFIGLGVGYWLYTLMFSGWLLATHKPEDITEDVEQVGESHVVEGDTSEGDASEGDNLWDGYSDARLLASVGALFGWQAAAWSFLPFVAILVAAWAPSWWRVLRRRPPSDKPNLLERMYTNADGLAIAIGAGSWMLGSVLFRDANPILFLAYLLLVGLFVLGLLQRQKQDWLPGSIPVWALILAPLAVAACPAFLHTYHETMFGGAWLPDGFMPVAKSLLGLGVGYWLLSMIAHLGKMWKGVEAMGYGDLKLMAGIGALLGWEAVCFTLLASALFGATVGITLLLMKRTKFGVGLPFGPYLAMGALLWMLGGSKLWDAYIASSPFAVL